PIGEEAGVTGNSRAVELQLDWTVEVNAQGVIVAVTPWVPRSFLQVVVGNAGFSREKAQTPCRNDRAIRETRVNYPPHGGRWPGGGVRRRGPWCRPTARRLHAPRAGPGGAGAGPPSRAPPRAAQRPGARPGLPAGPPGPGPVLRRAGRRRAGRRAPPP